GGTLLMAALFRSLSRWPSANGPRTSTTKIAAITGRVSFIGAYSTELPPDVSAEIAVRYREKPAPVPGCSFLRLRSWNPTAATSRRVWHETGGSFPAHRRRLFRRGFSVRRSDLQPSLQPLHDSAR